MTDINNARTDTAAAIEAGKKLGSINAIEHNNSRYILVPEGFRLQELSYLNGRPGHIEEVKRAGTVESFIGYFKRFANPHSIINANVETGEFLAILDYHRAEGEQQIPEYCHHVLSYDVPETPEWSAWRKNDGLNQTQEEFALFIEDQAPDILDPPAAEMLEIASTLQATTSHMFRRAIRLDNGQTQFTYAEQIDGAAGRENQLKIPTAIKLGVQIFRDRPRYEMTARFRYRIRESALKLRYELVRPGKTVEIAVRDILNEIRTAVPDHLIIER